MAAALRCAARRICGRALRLRPQASFTTAAEAAFKEAQPTKGLAKQIESTKHELLDLLGLMEAESSMGAEHKELQQVLQVNNNRFLADVYRGAVFTGIGTMIAGLATAIVGAKVFLPRRST